MESTGIDFLKVVSKGYKKIASMNQNRCKIIDCSNKDIIAIHNEIMEIFNFHYRKGLLWGK